jgi:hypothetical protein
MNPPMRPLPLWYSAALILVGVLLHLLAGGTWGIIVIAAGALGVILKLRIKQLDRRRERRR